MQAFDLWPIILPYSIIRTPYGGVANIRQLATVDRVCQDWHTWIYSLESGPFCCLGQKIFTIITIPPGSLGHPSCRLAKLNSAMQDFGREIFKAFDDGASARSYLQALPPLPSPRNMQTLTDINGKSLFIKAIDLALKDLNNLPLIEKCIKLNADLNALTPMKLFTRTVYFPPLIYVWKKTCSQNAMEVANFLVSQGANVHQQIGANQLLLVDGDSFSLEPFYHFCQQHIDHNQDPISIHQAICRTSDGKNYWSHTKLAFYLLDAGAEVTQVDSDDHYPLELYCQHFKFYSDEVPLLKRILAQAPCEQYLGKRLVPLLEEMIAKGKCNFLEAISDSMENRISKEMVGGFLRGLLQYISEQWRKDLFKDHSYELSMPLFHRKIKDIYLRLLVVISKLIGAECSDMRALLCMSLGGTGSFLFQLAACCPSMLKTLIEEKYITLEDLQLCDDTGKSISDIALKGFETISCTLACYRKDLNCLETFLKKGILPLSQLGEKKSSILHLMLFWNAFDKFESDNLTIFKRLLMAGISPNTVDIDGDTPLHIAICKGTPALDEHILALISVGADPLQPNQSGKTAYDKIQGFSRWNNIKTLIESII
jgi:ankyrin repeat protein